MPLVSVKPGLFSVWHRPRLADQTSLWPKINLPLGGDAGRHFLVLAGVAGGRHDLCLGGVRLPHRVLNHKVRQVAVKLLAHVTVPKEIKPGVELFQHLPNPGVAMPGGKRVGQTAGIPVQGDLVFFALFDLNVVINPVGYRQRLACLTAVNVDIPKHGVKFFYCYGGVAQEFRY